MYESRTWRVRPGEPFTFGRSPACPAVLPAAGLVRWQGLARTKPVTFRARWPADRARQHARDGIRELTRRSRLLLAPEWIVEDLNRFLGGWAAYFRFGNSTARFEKIRCYAR